MSYIIYSTLTRRAGVVGKFFFNSAALTVTCQNCLKIRGFFSAIFEASPC